MREALQPNTGFMSITSQSCPLFRKLGAFKQTMPICLTHNIIKMDCLYKKRNGECSLRKDLLCLNSPDSCEHIVEDNEDREFWDECYENAEDD